MEDTQEDNGRRKVTCQRCSTAWWVNYSEAVKAIQTGSMWIQHRTERQGETASSKGTLEEVPYLAGLCSNCDRGIMRPPVERESARIVRRAQHFARLVDPENALSYAIEEYNAEYGRTFQPEFQAWFEAHRPKIDVDLSLLPEEFLAEEEGWGDGSPRCPHVNPPVEWGQFGRIVGQ